MGTAEREPDLSVVITCFYEEKSIEEFHRRLSAAMRSLGRPFEIIFVNDGSTDGTFAKLRSIFERDGDVAAVIDLFKNSGQQAAMAAGLCEARGRALLFMDSDLQLSPEEIPTLVAAWDDGADVVSGCRVGRKDSLFRIIPSKLANAIMRRASHSDFHDFGCTFKIFDARLVRAFEFGPHRIFAPVDVIACAGRRCEIPVTHRPRKYGKSGWTFRKLMQYNMDNVVVLSDRPFQIVGLVCLLLTAALAVRTLAWFFTPFSVLGPITNGVLFNALVIATLAILAVLGMVGEFTIRAFIAARYVPKYVIREAIRR
jgi:glycosyltransferase involved in cell wall biosynthesis